MKQIILLLLSLAILLGNLPAAVFAQDATVPSSETTQYETLGADDLPIVTDCLSETLPQETEETGPILQEASEEDAAMGNLCETTDAPEEEAATEAVEMETLPAATVEETVPATTAEETVPATTEEETVPATTTGETVPEGTVPTEQVVAEGVTAAITLEENPLIVEVHQYISLGDKDMYLVTARWEDRVLSYGGENTMFYSSRYTLTDAQEAGAYCWLVISTDELNSADAVKTAACAAIAEAAEADAATAVRYDCDINQSSKVDVNDAQLAYDMYNTSYMEFSENLTMLKFLEADITADGKLDVNDIAAVVNFILRGTAN